MTRIGIIGAAGRMGQALVRCIRRFPDLHLTAAVESDKSPALGKDAGLVAGCEASDIAISCNTAEAMQEVDVLIDFSTPSSAVEHAELAGQCQKGMVTGVTGLDESQASIVRNASKRAPIVWAPNMSMGVNLLFDLTEKAAGILADYDIEIVETHHKHKKDAPSGTALRLLEKAAAARNADPNEAAIHGRHGQTGERPAGQIGMHAVRSGDVVGDHTVIIAGDGERIELTHRATSRDCFAMGALSAAKWVAGRKPGLYDMRDVLDLG